MSDWPKQTVFALPKVIHSLSSLSSDAGLVNLNNFASISSTVWPAANRAIYVPFFIQETVMVNQMAITVGTQSGNLDAGLYDVLGNRLVSIGSTAVAAAGFQALDIADTTLTPGNYFMALCIDNITAAIHCRTTPDVQTLRVIGVQEQALGSVTLPDPATFANPSSAYTPSISLIANATA
jgi:hypothetical protein